MFFRKRVLSRTKLARGLISIEEVEYKYKDILIEQGHEVHTLAFRLSFNQERSFEMDLENPNINYDNDVLEILTSFTKLINTMSSPEELVYHEGREVGQSYGEKLFMNLFSMGKPRQCYAQMTHDFHKSGEYHFDFEIQGFSDAFKGIFWELIFDPYSERHFINKGARVLRNKEST